MSIGNSAILRLVGAHKGLLLYTFLNYSDKLLVFCIPLIILWGFQDKQLYNEVEYIYSISTIVVVLLELGVRNYFIYAYKYSENKVAFLTQVRGFFALQFVVYLLGGSVLGYFSVFVSKIHSQMIFYVTIRSLYLYYISFHSIYYRLKDSPSTIFIPSVSISVLTLIASFLYWYIYSKTNIHVVLFVQTCFAIGALAFFGRICFSVDFSLFIDYLVRALKFAWPIILNLFLFMFINNLGKLYARNVLSVDEMTQISLIQRITMIIHLGHASAAGYYLKHMFMDDSEMINKRILIQYSMMLLGSVVVALLAIPIVNRYLPDIDVQLDVVAILFVGYTVAWCYASFLELYINKINKNLYIPLFTAISLFVLVLFVFFGPYDSIINISLGMFTSMIASCSLSLGILVKHHKKAKSDPSHKHVVVE